MIKNDKKHDYWLGALKGWAIILVVLGHTGIGEIVRVIYSFHMALFSLLPDIRITLKSTPEILMLF